MTIKLKAQAHLLSFFVFLRREMGFITIMNHNLCYYESN